MAFDNCTELERWNELSDFAAEMNRDGDRVHFTFFVSGVNFIADINRAVYEGPRQRRGYSRINFGGSPENVRRRVDYVNALHATGMRSLACGRPFQRRVMVGRGLGEGVSLLPRNLNDVGPNNGLADSRLAFAATDVIGFRAPYLAKSAGLYGALRNSGFRYDTSGVGTPMRGRKRSMELAIQPGNAEDPRIGQRHAVHGLQFLRGAVACGNGSAALRDGSRATLQTYLAYFKANYTGNRAPLHIGHHFSGYQGGAYNEALKSFARAVCGLPEVRCVTYAGLTEFMDRQSADTLAAYRKGDFARAGAPALNVAQSSR